MPTRILQYPMLSWGAPSSGTLVQDGEVEDTQLDAAEEVPPLSWAELTVLYADGVRQCLQRDDRRRRPNGIHHPLTLFVVATSPPIQENLLGELDSANVDGRLSMPAKYPELHKLLYLTTLVREVFRFYGGFAGPLWRMTPKGGVTIDGVYIPGATNIGVNPWAAGLNKDIYGRDTEVFRPERWLFPELPTAEEVARRMAMERAGIGFGVGVHACLGRSFARAEIYKTAAEMVGRFDLLLRDPLKGMRATNRLVWVHEGFDCFVVARGERKGGIIGS